MITSNCKKVMAFVLAVALLLSALFIPKTSKAAVEPSVKVLGATIRLSTKTENDVQVDNNGKQSMMIGIQVDHANLAGACAIDVTANGRTLRIATNSAKATAGTGTGIVQRELHSKNETDPNNKIITYALVVKNIPVGQFNTPFAIKGYVWNIPSTGTAEKGTSTGTVSKNVTGVV